MIPIYRLIIITVIIITSLININEPNRNNKVSRVNPKTTGITKRSSKTVVGTVGRSDDQSNRTDEQKGNKDRQVFEESISTSQWLYQEWDARYGERVAKEALKIIECESGFNINAFHHNSDKYKSTDWGIMQINDYWHDKQAIKIFGKKVKDLTAVENVQLGQYIYENSGNWSQWACSKSV